MKLVTHVKKTGDDRLLHTALQTKTGRKMMPVCAASYGNADHFAHMVLNTKRLLKAVGGRHKKEVAHLLIGGLPAWFSRNKLGLTKRQQQRAAISDVDIGRSVSDACYAENVKRDKIPPGMDSIFTQFFTRSTYQCSGADDDKARIMDLEFFEWEALLEAQWPGLLREQALRQPDQVPVLADMPSTGWTDYEACMLSALEPNPVDATEERLVRRTKFLIEYRLQLARVRGELPTSTKAELAARKQIQHDRTASRLHLGTFNPAEYYIQAPSLRTFRAWLKRKKLRFTRFSVPHPCPLCTAGPTDEVVFVALSKQVEELRAAGKPIPGELMQRWTKLRKSLRVYRVHITQLETARAEAKQAEDDLPPVTCMVIRDFVNHHDHSGQHVKCLHWVVMWCDKVGEPQASETAPLLLEQE